MVAIRLMILDIDEILPLPEEWSGDDSGGLFVLGDAPTTELSHETISKITDQVAEEVLAWQRRPLEALYPVIYLDALVVGERQRSAAQQGRPHLCGRGRGRIKHVLRICVQPE